MLAFGVYPGPGLLLCAAYSAAILSFVGAVHWGIALSSPTPNGRLVIGILPSIAATAGIMAPIEVGLLILVAGFVSFVIVERLLFAADLPNWYRGVRIPLTVLVCVALLIARALI